MNICPFNYRSAGTTGWHLIKPTGLMQFDDKFASSRVKFTTLITKPVTYVSSCVCTYTLRNDTRCSNKFSGILWIWLFDRSLKWYKIVKKFLDTKNYQNKHSYIRKDNSEPCHLYKVCQEKYSLHLQKYSVRSRKDQAFILWIALFLWNLQKNSAKLKWITWQKKNHMAKHHASRQFKNVN